MEYKIKQMLEFIKEEDLAEAILQATERQDIELARMYNIFAANFEQLEKEAWFIKPLMKRYQLLKQFYALLAIREFVRNPDYRMSCDYQLNKIKQKVQPYL